MEETKRKQDRLKQHLKKFTSSREFSSGGVVFRRVKEQESKRVKVLWLVTKSSTSKLYPKAVWRLPKGWIDDEEGDQNPGPVSSGIKKAGEDELKQAALREVREEAGVKAKVVKKIGTERYFFTFEGKKILKFVTFYLMEWINDIPEGPGFETQEVKWLPFNEARKILTYSGEKVVLDKAKRVLESGIQENLL